LGGHCIYVVAYNQHPGYFTLRNSWGTGWGDKGDFYLPEEYLSNPNLGSDYWIIQTVSK
jgi:C1A family cysteine protease